MTLQFKTLVIRNKDQFSDYIAAGYKKCINKRKVHKDNNRDEIQYEIDHFHYGNFNLLFVCIPHGLYIAIFFLTILS